MKKLIITAIATMALTAASFGQGYAYVQNLANTGTYNGFGGTAFNPNTESGNPVYSANVTSNGLFFTTDTANTWGANGGPTGNQLLGTDISFAIYGSATQGGTFTFVTSFTGNQINTPSDDNANWGQLQGPGAAQGFGNASSPTSVWIELYAWEGSAFSTYASAVSGGDYTAFSGAFLNPSATSSGAPIIPSLTGMPDMLLSPVPEPCTLALVGLGGAGLLAIRRRKA
jgi:hypothetical protein